MITTTTRAAWRTPRAARRQAHERPFGQRQERRGDALWRVRRLALQARRAARRSLWAARDYGDELRLDARRHPGRVAALSGGLALGAGLALGWAMARRASR